MGNLIACKTCDEVSTPEEQAEPVEIASWWRILAITALLGIRRIGT